MNERTREAVVIYFVMQSLKRRIHKCLNCDLAVPFFERGFQTSFVRAAFTRHSV